jgi:hypothetical protein
MSFSIEERFTHVNEVSFIVSGELLDEDYLGACFGVRVVLRKLVIRLESLFMCIGTS